jgi:hypothetical protein
VPSIFRIRKRLSGSSGMRAQIDRVATELDALREAVGRLEERQVLGSAASMNDSEFKVYSQFGEDGVLQWLLHRVPVPRRYFVEFGVEDYTEATTRWLASRHGWEGLVLDGSESNVERIRSSRLSWSNRLTAVSAFVTAENIDELLAANGAVGDIGVLSVDIDGNDYWVWKAITCIRPAIVVVEYNHRWGPDRSVTIPYDPRFYRRAAHWSHVYYGASLAALCRLGEEKGYDFVGCGRAGVNAFFVRGDLRPHTVPRLTPTEGFQSSTVRESTDAEGRYTFLTTEEELRLVAHLPLVEIPAARHRPDP